MRTIAAKEIKRRGISAVDGELQEGPVHVIKDDRPAYVVMDRAQYEELLAAGAEAEIARVRASLEDMRTGRTRRVTAQQLIDEHDLDA